MRIVRRQPHGRLPREPLAPRAVFHGFDPDRVAGPDLGNLVTACGRCNQEKGARTPAEADMRLLPVPSPERASALFVRTTIPSVTGVEQAAISERAPLTSTRQMRQAPVGVEPFR